MSEDAARPWWYSGDEQPEPEIPEPQSPTGESGGGGLDVMAMLSGAVRMMDWAAGAVVEPHADHTDPGSHPECLICRTLVLVTDRTGMTPPSASTPVPQSRVPGEPVRWIPIRD